jgi:hypothetical protein
MLLPIKLVCDPRARKDGTNPICIQGEPITFNSLDLNFYEEFVYFLTYDYT